MTIITCYGFDFCVQGDGFAELHATADLERGIDAVHSALAEMTPDDVAELHAADTAWESSDQQSPRPSGIDALEAEGLRAATEGWRRPEAVSIFVSAA